MRAALETAARGTATNYYDRALILFGKGWLDGQYKFGDDGRLQPKWQGASAASAPGRR